MRRLLLLLLAIALPCFLQAPAHAQARAYGEPELEALVAPVALYPDALLSHILTAATYPGEVAEAARAPGVDDPAWNPSVRALVPFPELLQRMADSPQWMLDLGNAALAQGPELTQAVQLLRQRAYAAGYLRSNEQQRVQMYGQSIYVQPAVPQVVYMPYYNPLVVYGVWLPAYRVVYWQPWPTRPCFVSNVFFVRAPRWHHWHDRAPNGPPSPAAQMQSSAPPIAQRGNGGPSPALQLQQQRITVTPFVPVPQSSRQPVIQSTPRPQWRSDAGRHADPPRRQSIIQSAPLTAQRANGPPSQAAQIQQPNRPSQPSLLSQPQFQSDPHWHAQAQQRNHLQEQHAPRHEPRRETRGERHGRHG